MRTQRSTLLIATALAGVMSAGSAMAQDTTHRIDSIEAQITQLQQELKRVRNELAARDAQVKAAQNDAARSRSAAERAASQVQAQAGQGQVQGGGAISPSGGTVPANVDLNGAARQETASSGGGQAAGTTGPSGSFRVGGVTVTLGGFFAAEGLYRSRNDIADTGSNFNTIPLAQSPNYHTGEFRGSARQSRL